MSYSTQTQTRNSSKMSYSTQTQTQNSLKMSNSTQNLDSKLTENELLNSKLKPKTHQK
jgi:hypothetical protein